MSALCRCGGGEPSPGAAVAGVSPVPVQMWQGADALPGFPLSPAQLGRRGDGVWDICTNAKPREGLGPGWSARMGALRTHKGHVEGALPAGTRGGTDKSASLRRTFARGRHTVPRGEARPSHASYVWADGRVGRRERITRRLCDDSAEQRRQVVAAKPSRAERFPRVRERHHAEPLCLYAVRACARERTCL